MIRRIPSSLLLLTAYLLASFSLCPIAQAASADKENEVKSILQRMETDVLAFRDEMERVYSARCETKTLTECARNNFNDCSSTFSRQQCMKSDELVISTCGDGVTCNALWDKSLSTVSIPNSLAQGSLGNPDDDEVIESVCYSRLAETYMANKYISDENYWAKWNVQPSWTYFGAHNGLFRKIPATHQEECGQYDPRRRPWFVAASSGPKDVVIVIDVSGSMEDYGRISIAKDAATTIVETLTVADRVAVVSFSGRAYQIGGYSNLIRATNENKERLIEAIKNLGANGGTNFYDAFRVAFDSLEKTIKNEYTSGCNIAVLFMTDGQISQGPQASEVINLVNNRTEQLATNFDRKATLFTFSLGHAADHSVPKTIACSTNGIWTPVDDLTGDLVTAMSSYYKLFSVGLGEGGNEEFTAWVEPYEFNNPAGKVGTTVSAPVYDRSVKPPLFLGVVAVDIYMDTIEQVLGEGSTSSSMLQRFVQLSTARCPKLELTGCELDGLRFLGGGEQATCSVCNSTYAGIVPAKCPFNSDLPNNLWHNTDMEGKKYEDRACCESGGIVPSESCPDFKLSSGAKDSLSGTLAGILFGSAVACVAFYLCAIMRQTRAKSKQQEQSFPAKTRSRSTANPNEGQDGNILVEGRDDRRSKLHAELAKLGIDLTDLEARPEGYGTAAMRTYNSFLLPKSRGALAVANSPTRPRVVANNISLLAMEFKADQEEWLWNIDRNRIASGEAGDANQNADAETAAGGKNKMVIVLDNVRSVHNVGNILRLAEAAQVESVRLCGIPKVLKTAMGALEHVSLGDEEDAPTTLQTVIRLKSKGYKVFGVETTENSTSLWDAPTADDGTESIAYVFGNELFGVDVQVLRECDGIVCLPTYGIKNSLNVATCVGIVVWDTLRRLQKMRCNVGEAEKI